MSAPAAKILVVEDEKDIRDLIALHLRRSNYTVEEATTGEEAIQKMSANSYGMVVLDWMLPQVSGMDVLRWLRDQANFVSMPVLLLTAKASTSDIVFGLESGADDYMTKPFEPVVLLARVRALLRRQPSEALAPHKTDDIVIGDLTINPSTHAATFKGQPLELTPSEFKLLHALAQNRGRVLTRDKLIHLVQGEGVSVVDRAIDTHVFGLRKKMGDSSHFIETVRGVGYRINFAN